MLFPKVKGSNLQREALELPRDFQGKFNLLFIPFQQWQQMEVDSWQFFVKTLEEEFENFYYYELPTLQNSNPLYKLFINEGMRAGIPNNKTRNRTITLFLDKATFKSALNFTDEGHIYILLINAKGEELFRTRGPYTPEAADSLITQIKLCYASE